MRLKTGGVIGDEGFVGLDNQSGEQKLRKRGKGAGKKIFVVWCWYAHIDIFTIIQMTRKTLSCLSSSTRERFFFFGFWIGLVDWMHYYLHLNVDDTLPQLRAIPRSLYDARFPALMFL